MDNRLKICRKDHNFQDFCLGSFGYLKLTEKRSDPQRQAAKYEKKTTILNGICGLFHTERVSANEQAQILSRAAGLKSNSGMLTAFDNFFTKLTARVEGNYLAGLNNGGFAGLRITSRTLAFLLDGKKHRSWKASVLRRERGIQEPHRRKDPRFPCRNV